MFNGNPFEVLGVSNNASIDECKKKYRELCKKYHPDNVGNADKFDLVNKAFKAIETGDYYIVQKVKRSKLRHKTLFSYSC